MSYTLLSHVDSPTDVKALSEEQLPQLCRELRDKMIETTAKTGGHLASSLGVVELTVALHRIFDSPDDTIVWDVGHQSYAHKLLTGRKERFSTLRQKDGLSGFPKPQESIHDAFVTGHSSTSISAASGMARAKTLKNDPHSCIAVIGDGAFTSGLAYEAINNAARSGDRIIVILNDNKMSISKNDSSLAKYLSNIRSTPSYFKMKDNVQAVCQHIPVFGKPLEKGLMKLKSTAKTILYGSNFFEDLGFRYLGPVDGHDIKQLCAVLTRAKELHGPIFLHVETTKGKGYSYAEQNPGEFHGTSGFDIQSGVSKSKLGGESFSDVFGKHLSVMAGEDERICAITAAMKYGTGLNHFSKQWKSSGRYFDVGIAEPHAVTFAAGLAAQGMTPVFAVYSSFLQRCYDNILHDCCIQPQHVVLAVDRAGIVGADGETHNGLFDVAMMLNIPNIAMYSPATFAQLRWSMEQAIHKEKQLTSIRYPRGGEDSDFAKVCKAQDFQLHNNGGKGLIISYGAVSAQAYQAAKELGADLLQLCKIFPLEQEVFDLAKGYERILFVEEGIKTGGLGQHMASQLLEQGYKGDCRIRAVESRFVPHMSAKEALAFCRLDAESIINDYKQYFA